MSIDANMILENDRLEEETTRANLKIFLAEQEAETLRCQQLRERVAGGSSAMRGESANVSNTTMCQNTSAWHILCSL
jgi:hypothetical protein